MKTQIENLKQELREFIELSKTILGEKWYYWDQESNDFIATGENEGKLICSLSGLTSKQNVMLRTLGNALALITEEYEDRRFQFGDDPLWQKHEGNNPLPTAFAALDAYELKGVELKQALIVVGELKQAAKQELQEAVTRMEAVPVQELDKIWDDAPGGSALVGFEAVRTRLIQAAKGEQP